ncbi:MAG: hypothetical protein JSR53_04420 [Proteobacteria bacterium]|nr:hypothetical protein [Pseudomonadota bacterium]
MRDGGRHAVSGVGAALAGCWCACVGLWLAAQHPVAPILALALLSAAMAWVMWRPADLWFLLPALLPVASFAPWTGWWLVDESDLLVLAVLAGAYLRWAGEAWLGPVPPAGRTPADIRWAYWVLPPLLLLGLWRGLDDARGAQAWAQVLADLWTQGPYGDYDLPGNTLRVAKSLAWGLALMPVMYRWPEGARLRLARGMLVGLAWIGGAVLWERALYVGWLDFSTGYRTVAWFWEMHVGGGAIDAYLAMALPFAWWAAWSAPHGWRWYAAAALALLATYAVLTTYSRGLYLTVIITALGMAALAHKYRLKAPDATLWHRRAMAWLLAALVLEIMVVWTGGVFLSDRMVRSKVDLYQRMAHWKRGVDLLQTPGQWLLGLGVGRLPAHYSAQAAEGALPGRVRWLRHADGSYEVRLSGPQRAGARGELALAQGVGLESGGHYTVRLRAHIDVPMWLKVQLCEQYLLYTAECQLRTRQVSDAGGAADGWIVLPLLGPAFPSGDEDAVGRSGVLSIKLLQPNAAVGITAIELIDPKGRQVLKNSDLSLGPRHWSSIAYGNFLPWHMDNLLLELLIERGLLGLLVLAALVLWALWHVAARMQQREPLALVLGGAIMAALMVGGLISFMEIPRVSLVLWLLLAVSFCVNEEA